MFDTHAREKVVDRKYGGSHNIIQHKVYGIAAYMRTCASFMQEMMTAGTHL